MVISKSYEFDIVFSDLCNLSCPFCYSSSRRISSENMETLRKNIDVTKLIESARIFCHILKRSGDFENSTFGFTGGEPAIFPLQVIDEVFSVFKSHFPSARFTFTTNGTFLNSYLLKWLSERDISLSISLDPYFDNYNVEFLIEKLRLLESCGIYHNVQVHLILKRGVNLNLMFNILDRFGFLKADLSLFIPSGRGRKYYNNLVLYEKEITDLVKQILDSKYVDRFSSLLDLISVIKKSLYIDYHNHIWGVCWRKYRLNLDSGIIVNPEDCVSGFVLVAENLTVYEIDFYLRKSEIIKKSYDSFCVDCEFFWFCRGGCLLYSEDRRFSCKGMKEVLSFFKEV